METGALCGTSYSGKVFEAHITVEPCEGDLLGRFKAAVKPYGFRVADLVMIKDRKVTDQRSDRDSFCTGWGDSYEEIKSKVEALVDILTFSGIKVWRWKIEMTIEDWRSE